MMEHLTNSCICLNHDTAFTHYLTILYSLATFMYVLKRVAALFEYYILSIVYTVVRGPHVSPSVFF